MIPTRSITNTVYDGSGVVVIQQQVRPLIRTGSTVPSGIVNAAPCDIYYDTSNTAVYWFNNEAWVNFNSYTNEIKSGTNKPTNPALGNVFLDTSDGKAYWYNGNAWTTFLGYLDSGSSIWQPSTAQTTIQLWLDAGDTSTITTGGNLAYRWLDKSGKGNHVSYFPYPPYYAKNIQNSKNVLCFHNVGNCAGVSGSFSTALTGSTLTLFAVAGFDRRICGVSGRILSIGQTGANDNDGNGAYIGRNNKSFISAYRNGNITTTTIDASTNAIYVKPCITIYDISGTSASLYLNGTLQQTTTIGVSQIGTPITKYSIGEDVKLTGGGFRWGGHICEVGVLTGGLPVSGGIPDRQRLEGFLAWKWGIQSYLPANHPYKNDLP